MSTIHPLDLGVLIVTVSGAIGLGVWLGRGQAGGRDYFLGGRELPWMAVMLSIVATETSTLTFLSIPGVAYLGTLGFLQLALGYLAGRAVIAAVLLPAYWKGELATAYALLEERFGRRARRFTSAIFMGTRLLADGVRLFATAIPLALLTGWPLTTSVLVIGVATALYTASGGIRAVVWVDAAQFFLYLAGAAIAAAALGGSVPGGWEAILGAAGEAGKLVVIDPSFTLDRPYTLWAGLIGGAFLSMASHGTDQLIVQRLLTCRDLTGARKALVTSGAVVIVQFAAFLLIGIGLWAHYGGRPFAQPDAIFPRFIVDALPAGVTGLLVAGTFAAAMSSLSSSINALASASAYDFWAPAKGGRDDRAILRAGRVFSLGWTVLLIGAALGFGALGSDAVAVEVALGISALVYGGLLGIFGLALLVPPAREPDAIVAIAVGVVTMLGVWGFMRQTIAWPWFVPLGTVVTLATGTLLALGREGLAGATSAGSLS